MTLHQIRAAVRPQFVWDALPNDRYRVSQIFNYNSKYSGLALFAAMSVIHYHTLEDIAIYTGYDKQKIKSCLCWYIRQTKLFGNKRQRPITEQILRKTKMTLSFMKLHYKSAPGINTLPDLILPYENTVCLPDKGTSDEVL